MKTFSLAPTSTNIKRFGMIFLMIPAYIFPINEAERPFSAITSHKTPSSKMAALLVPRLLQSIKISLLSTLSIKYQPFPYVSYIVIIIIIAQ
jgi:hypothetical protein